MTRDRHLILLLRLVKIDLRRTFSPPYRILAAIQETEPEKRAIYEEFKKDNPREYEPID